MWCVWTIWYIMLRWLFVEPGAVGNLLFTDILLDSVNVSWTPPEEANGVVIGYVVSYETFKVEIGRDLAMRNKFKFTDFQLNFSFRIHQENPRKSEKKFSPCDEFG